MSSNRFRLTVIVFSLILGFIAAIGCNTSVGKRVRLTPTPGPPEIEVVLTGLDNPRGLVVGPAGELFVAEAGTGYDSVDPTKLTGKLTKFIDRNGDGDFDDEAKVEPWFSQLPTYNADHFTGSARDEVNGPGDVLLHRDGRIFLSLDGGFDKQALREISPERRVGRNLADRSNMNGIAFGPNQASIYAVESMANQQRIGHVVDQARR